MKLDEPAAPWYRLLTRYHWFVLAVAAMGWLFDCLDQQLFVLARPSAMRELLPPSEDFELQVKNYTTYATSIFLIGWATGGLFFGVLGDRIGRAKTMLITILVYSICTGLSALSVGFWDFAFYRFLTGLGVGGEFAVGVALVAEVMPARARPYTLAGLQAFSAIGNVSAALIFLGLGIAQEDGLAYSPWRIMFVIGAAPALLAVVIRWRLKEPEQWQKASHDDAVSKQLGSYRELFGDPRWRRNAIVGLLLASSGVIGLWAIGFFTMDLITAVQRPRIAAEVYDEQIAAAKSEGDSERVQALETLREIETAKKRPPVPEELLEIKGSVDGTIGARLAPWPSFTSICINVGAFFGMFGFGALSQRIGRRPTFAISFIAALISTAATFWFLTEFWQIFVFVPIMGFCQLSLFAGYAMYFPELFPTRLRSTGTSFCYNVGRFIAASGPLALAQLNTLFKDMPEEPMRYAGVAMCSIFLLGLVVLPFAPETKGKPLPE